MTGTDDQSVFEILIPLEDSKEPNQIAVVVIDNFFFNRLFPQEHLCAAHAGFHIGSVGRHERIDGRIDTPLVSSPGERTHGTGHNEPPSREAVRIKQKQAVLVFTHANGLQSHFFFCFTDLRTRSHISHQLLLYLIYLLIPGLKGGSTKQKRRLRILFMRNLQDTNI